MAELLGDRYRLEEELGRGSIGTVYRAVDELLTRPVAVKIVDRSLTAEPEIRDRIRQAGAAVARLTHPNLVTVFDVTTLDDQLCIVMEHVDGPDFSQILEDGGLSADRVAALGRDLAAALGTAHAAGVVHGHLHPKNVLLTSDGVPKVVDLGLARHVVVHDAEPESSSSPWLSDDAEPTPSSDVYSLGALLRQAVADGKRRRSSDLHDVLDAATRDAAGQRLDDGAQLAAALQGIAGTTAGFVPPLRRRARDIEQTAVLDTVPAVDRDATAPQPIAARDNGAATTRVMPVGVAAGGGARTAAPAPDPERVDAGGDDLAPSWRRGLVLAVLGLAVVGVVGVQFLDDDSGQAGGGEGSGDVAASVAIANAEDFDPLGGGGEHGGDVGESFDGDPATAWTTEGYDTPALGGLKSGVGIMYDLGDSHDVGRVDLALAIDGVDASLYAFTDRPPGDPDTWGDPVATLNGASGTQQLGIPEDVVGRYWVIWFTNLGPDGGRYRGGVSEVSFAAR